MRENLVREELEGRSCRNLTELGVMLRAAFACHISPKPASGRSKRKQHSVTPHLLKEDFWPAKMQVRPSLCIQSRQEGDFTPSIRGFARRASLRFCRPYQKFAIISLGGCRRGR